MATAALLAPIDASANVPVSNVKVERSNSNLIVAMKVDAPQQKVGSNNQIVLTPVITNGVDSLRLDPIVIAGRARYIQNQRLGAFESVPIYRYADNLSIDYSTVTPYAQWMETSQLVLLEDASGCCNNLGHDVAQLADIDFAPRVFAPQFVFVTPAAEAVKTREVKGSAFIDFKVNQTVILPEYRRNPEELAKIRKSIDVVRDNKDTRITSLTITGYASPEGPYDNNVRLADGRTKALCDYVQKLYSFDKSILHTSSVPEDWDGVLAFLNDNPDFANRQAILDIVNGDRDPDAKNWAIKKNFPEQYDYMLRNLYPALRHSDYAVEYVVRSYSDPAEIAQVLRTAPQNLSLQELYVLARSLPEGSDEYNEVFETAVRMYPNDATANLNAASSAIMRNDLNSARRYLEKAGNNPQAVYARGIVAAKDGEYRAALTLMKQAADAGVEQAADAMKQINDIMERL